jgi:elongator complex protein 1
LAIAEYIFTACRGSTSPPHDHGGVAVIDGTTLKLTPFRTAYIPPPMAMFDIELRANAIDVAFAPDNSLMAVLHLRGVDLFKWSLKGDRTVQPTRLTRNPSLWSDTEPMFPLRISFSAGETLSILYSNGRKAILRSYEWVAPTFVELPEVVEETGVVMTLPNTSTSASNGLIVQHRDGKLVYIDQNSLALLSLRFPVPCPLFEVVEVREYAVAFGLSRNSHLYANSRLLVKNCTSYLVTPSHLIYTTNNHLIKFVHLSDPTGKPLTRVSLYISLT